MGNSKNALSEVTKIGNYAIPAFSAFLTAALAVGSFPKSAEWQAIIVNFALYTVAAAYVSYVHRIFYLRRRRAQQERGEKPTNLCTWVVILFLVLHLLLVSFLSIRLWPLGSFRETFL
jgi:NADH:ubiquinone oxidoreductase subunit 4 (subunit M)